MFEVRDTFLGSLRTGASDVFFFWNISDKGVYRNLVPDLRGKIEPLPPRVSH